MIIQCKTTKETFTLKQLLNELNQNYGYDLVVKSEDNNMIKIIRVWCEGIDEELLQISFSPTDNIDDVNRKVLNHVNKKYPNEYTQFEKQDINKHFGWDWVTLKEIE